MRAFDNLEECNPFQNPTIGNCDWLIYTTKQNETLWMDRVAQPQLTLKQQISYDLPQKNMARLLLRFTHS